ncbi:37773_t:CDS:2 [Gigaspora margarita]|uniref:37773_t:CDS:1 n=1 Tax=Gigaspora margarita TaxID=4874 RepID=A0ABN7UWS3_GIGMA|nr:37773_t:CDS:2 [Gigaspora margarita]
MEKINVYFAEDTCSALEKTFQGLEEKKHTYTENKRDSPTNILQMTILAATDVKVYISLIISGLSTIGLKSSDWVEIIEHEVAVKNLEANNFYRKILWPLA